MSLPPNSSGSCLVSGAPFCLLPSTVCFRGPSDVRHLSIFEQVRSWPHSYRLSGATSKKRSSLRISALRTYSPSVALLPYMVSSNHSSHHSGNKFLLGRLSDILGRKGAMLLALTLFGKSQSSLGIRPTDLNLPQDLARSLVVLLLLWKCSFLHERLLAWVEAGASVDSL